MKVAKKARRGGRPHLTPSKRTQTLLERLEEIGFDPVEELIRDLSQIDDAFQRAQIIERMWRYIFPARKAVDITATSTNTHVSLSPEEVRHIFNSDPFATAIEVRPSAESEPPHRAPPQPTQSQINSNRLFLDEVLDSGGASPQDEDEEEDPLA